MAAVDQAFMNAVLPWLSDQADKTGSKITLIYTGGVWLYGPAGDQVIIEGTPFNPPPEFAFMVQQREQLFRTDNIRACVIHPAMVWNETGGTIEGFLTSAANGTAPKITGRLHTRWPMVYRDDLAELYCIAIEKAEHGKDYHGVSEASVSVGEMATVISQKFGAPPPIAETVEAVVAERGSWASCAAYDQTMDAPFTRDALGWVPKMTKTLKTLKG